MTKIGEFFKIAFKYDDWHKKEFEIEKEKLKKEAEEWYKKIYPILEEYTKKHRYSDLLSLSSFLKPSSDSGISFSKVQNTSVEDDTISLKYCFDIAFHGKRSFRFYYLLQLKEDKIEIGKEGRIQLAYTDVERYICYLIARAANVIFQKDLFGDLVWEYTIESQNKNIEDYNSLCDLISNLACAADCYGFSIHQFDLEHRDPFLHYLITYHKLYPSVKFNSSFLYDIKALFERIANDFVLTNYGDDYYENPNNFSNIEEINEKKYCEWREQRRWRACCDERLHDLFNDLCDPNNPDSAAMFADNLIGNRDAIDLIRNYYYCEYDNRHDIFFGDKESKSLLDKNEITRKLDQLDAEKFKSN